MWLFAFLNIQAFAKKEKTSLSGKEEGGPDLSSVHGVEKWTAPLQLEVARILAEICVLDRERERERGGLLPRSKIFDW